MKLFICYIFRAIKFIFENDLDLFFFPSWRDYSGPVRAAFGEKEVSGIWTSREYLMHWSQIIPDQWAGNETPFIDSRTKWTYPPSRFYNLFTFFSEEKKFF